MAESIQDSKKESSGGPPVNRSVKRAAAILELVATEPAGRTAKEVAVGVGLALPTAYHLLGSLVGVELLTKSASRRYVLGPKLGLLAEAFSAQMRAPQYLLQRLEQLAEQTGETAYLSVWREDDAVVMSIIEGRHAVRVSGLHLGYRGEAHRRATGKVLLAFAPSGTVDRYVASHELAADAADGTNAIQTLRDELEAIRDRGYAIDEEDFAPGVACISAPVGDGSVAICVSAPVERFRLTRDRLLAAVRDAVSDATVSPLTRERSG
jgi:DNA-binding IclR family transcriptional regulator